MGVRSQSVDARGGLLLTGRSEGKFEGTAPSLTSRSSGQLWCLAHPSCSVAVERVPRLSQVWKLDGPESKSNGGGGQARHL